MIVVGKGGVGKFIMVVVLVLVVVRWGKCVFVIELGGKEKVVRLLGYSIAVGYELMWVVEDGPGSVDVIKVMFREVLHEYGLMKLWWE